MLGEIEYAVDFVAVGAVSSEFLSHDFYAYLLHLVVNGDYPTIG